jgi:hypothetical protein
MRSIAKYVFLSILLLSNLMAGNGQFYHLTPQGVVKGDVVTLEVMVSNPDSRIYDMYLYYRPLGATDYKYVSMDRSGFIYSANINTGEISTGQIEYYFGYEGELGEVGSLPEVSPENSPYIMQVAPNNSPVQPGALEILILSPDQDEVVAYTDLTIAASVLGGEGVTDLSNFSLMIDGTDVTNLAEFSDGILTFSPKQSRGGYHNIELSIFDASNNLLGKKEWSFRASGGSPGPETSESYYRGSAFLEERYLNIGQNKQNFFRGGATVDGKVNQWEYRARLILSSEEAKNRQPVNRYAAQLVYNFSERNNIYVYGGDFTPYYNQIAFMNKRVRGIETGLAFGFFTFDFLYGQTFRAIEGKVDYSEFNLYDPANPGTIIGTAVDTLLYAGTYAENVMAFRPGFRFGETVQWNLNLINSREQKNSIEYGGNVRESLVAGTDLNMSFDNRRVLLDASVQASINNTNAGLPEISYDSLAKVDEDLANNDALRSYWNFLESLGMISMTAGLNPYPSLGMRFEAVLRYFNNNLSVKYTSIGRDFASPGNPYLLKDIAGIYISDNFRMINNQLFTNLYFRSYSTNRSQNVRKTQNTEFGATVSYFPQNNLPSLTLGYSSLNRANDVSLNDTALFERPEFYIEDNKTQNFMISTSYNFDLNPVKNTVSLNFSTYMRDEALEIKQENQSDFNIIGIGLLSRFKFPLTTRINYSRSETAFGEVNKSTTNINRYFLGLEYRLRGLASGDLLKPFLNFTFQNIDFTNVPQAKRNNFTLGVDYKNPIAGVFSLRYDLITFGGEAAPDYNDSVLNARYQYNF